MSVIEGQGRGYGYVRVSRDKEDKLSDDVQRERIEASCKSKGIDFKKHFEDLDVSGRIFNRPGWDEMLATLKAGDVLVTLESSRLGRDSRQVANVLYDLKQAGIRVICLDIDFDTESDVGEAALQLMLVFSELEWKQTRRRMEAAKKKSRECGRWQGGTPPMGYKKPDKADKRHGKLEVVKERAKAVRQIFKLASEGMSSSAISDEMEKRGIRGERGGRLQNSSIQTILMNTTYVGLGKWGVGEYELDEKCVPRIIERELWDKVQDVLGVNKHLLVRRGTYLCSRLLKCGICGATMVRRIRYKKGDGRYVKGEGYDLNNRRLADYFCFAAHNPVDAKRRGLDKCIGVMIREPIIEKYVTEQLFKHVKNELLKAEIDLLEEGANKDAGAGKEKQIITLRKRLNKLKKKEGRLIDLFADERIDRSVLQERCDDLKKQVEALEGQIRASEAKLALKTRQVEKIAPFESLEKEWPSLTVEQRRRLLRCFVHDVHVVRGRGTDRITINWI